MPMLYATTTTFAGFASLATTPIPPVKIFGLHVAFGVAIGWLLTMTFVPAFITLFISDKSLQRLTANADADSSKHDSGPLSIFLHWMGDFTYRRSWLVVAVSSAILGFSIYGITLIKVNDNPVKWFSKNHELRIADKVLNDHFGGTYTAYLTLAPTNKSDVVTEADIEWMQKFVEKRFGKVKPDAVSEFATALSAVKSKVCAGGNCPRDKFLAELNAAAGALDKQAGPSWENLADAINEFDPDGLTYESLAEKVRALKGVKTADVDLLLQRLKADSALTGDDLMDKALDVCDTFTALSWSDMVADMETELNAPAFKRPDVLHYIEGLQNYLISMDKVGKTSSTVDALKKASYELQYVKPDPALSAAELAKLEESNQSHFAIPESAAAVGQVYMQLEGMKKKDTLFHLVTRKYDGYNIWVQLTSGDNQDMNTVVEDVAKYVSEHKPPIPLDVKWAGLTYLNVVWQKKMVVGMMFSLISSFVVVLVMMLVLFRSGLFGILAMLPLTVTIVFIYGLIGWIGKDYDMPVAILSAMTLGLSVDFAIHFLERGREMYKKTGNWKEANQAMFRDPAKAISRNAIVISLGFMPLLLAPLIPYRTVGIFLALIMLVSWLATLFILPALAKILEKRLFKTKGE
jgi:predicted RND superfamily exporter protein